MATVTTRTRTSTIAGLVCLALIGAGPILPAFAPRSLIQDLFFILTMLTLAQLWNLIAGFGGMVSVGQQAFVGIGAYAMFAGVILWGWDPVPAILLGGLAAFLLAIPMAFFAFRLAGAYFAIATGLAMVIVTLAALYLGMRANFDPSIGPARLLYAFQAVIIGGLGSLWGTLAGGAIIGVAQTLGAQVNPEWQILAGHIAFLIVLLIRPRGLFPRAVD